MTYCPACVQWFFSDLGIVPCQFCGTILNVWLEPGGEDYIVCSEIREGDASGT